jgi:aryl-alcohol dehydrogenase-like predicted oxidoreductase
LTGKYPPSDFRAHAPRFTGENFEANKSKVELLQNMARKKGCTTSQLSLAWVLHKGDNILPLFGTTKKSRLKENAGAVEIKLTPDELDTLDKTFPEGSFAGTRYAAQQMGMVVN